MLSAAVRSAWGKSDRDTDESLSLHRHLEDTLAVGTLLWDFWLPAATRRVISEALPEGDADGRILVQWMAGAHDLGKLTPAFACQVKLLANNMHDAGLKMPYTPSNRRQLPHALASQVAIEQYLQDLGWERRVARTYSTVAGSHHGVPPTTTESNAAPDQTALLGEGSWHEARRELLAYITKLAGADARLADWSQRPLPLTTQAVLTAVVIMADWIASNQELFPLSEYRDSAATAQEVWEQLGFTSPWQIPARPADDSWMQERFSRPSMRPLQRECVRLANEMTRPGLLVVEAPMGMGKTEAALLAAEVLARRFGQGGVFLALPTMATSDAMFGRVMQWLRTFSGESTSMFLAHGKAALNEEFTKLKYAEYSSIGECAAERITAHSWMAGRKRGPLADFVVGTIDQVLTGALKVRHTMLRHLALVNKVVIIDEVHAADSYMCTYLAMSLEWLGAYKVPVILLSATLPPKQREALVSAYQRGANDGVTPERAVTESGYPSITVATGADVAVHDVQSPGADVAVAVAPMRDDLPALANMLQTELVDGGCAGVVCNTVGRAQATFTELRAHFPDDELLLIHSRFIAHDRRTLETSLRSKLGPPEAASRPVRLIVVGTQVIEQSLDIDFDLLITDLAPVDLVLQRMGRLHRHQRAGRPARVAAPRCFIRGAEWVTPPKPDAGSVSVYQLAPLLRSAAVLENAFSAAIQIPADVPSLVRDAYSDDLAVDPAWIDTFTAAEMKWKQYQAAQQHKAGSYLLSPPYSEDLLPPTLRGWLEGRASDADGEGGQAQVRDGEESLEVIVVQRIAGEVRSLIDGAVIPADQAPSAQQAKALAACMLRFPASFTNYGQMDPVIDALERAACYDGWQQSPWLQGELILELDAELSAEILGQRITYDPVLGLKIGEEENDGK